MNTLFIVIRPMDTNVLCSLLTCRAALSESLMSITRPAFTTTFGSLLRN